MNVRRASFIIALALTVAGTAGPAAAQFFPPTQPQQPPPCVKGLMALRDAAVKRGKAVQAAEKHKASAKEACRLLGALARAQAKMLEYAKKNESSCGIPKQIVKQIEVGHANAAKARARVCEVAANPPRPRGPTLSDALGAGIPDSSNIKRGSGTFDTLTGSPLGR
ncbi:MAG: hypothetical protein P8Y53_11075 [Pseudolabrys sp.]